MAMITKESMSYDNLFSGGSQIAPVVPIHGLVKAGEGLLTRGTPMAYVAGSSKLVKASTDSSLPVGILANDVDATSDAECVIYASGEFNKNVVDDANGSDLSDEKVLEFARIGVYIV